MANKRQLHHAPIVEALLDIQVRPPSGTTYESLSAYADLVADAYPTKRERHEVTAQLQGDLSGEFVPSASRTPVGYLMTSADGAQVVQARINGFSFSRLAPYTSWDDVKAEAKRLWKIYRDLVEPETTTRLALRYINRIPLPLPIADFGDYIKTGPTIAPGIPQALAHFFFNVSIPVPDKNGAIIITETIEQPTEKSELPLIFDIDVSRMEMIEPASETIWETFDDICAMKDQVFFSSLTDKGLELFA